MVVVRDICTVEVRVIIVCDIVIGSVFISTYTYYIMKHFTIDTIR